MCIKKNKVNFDQLRNENVTSNLSYKSLQYLQYHIPKGNTEKAEKKCWKVKDMREEELLLSSSQRSEHPL